MATGKYPSDRQDQFMLRLPDGMRQRLKEAAESNQRSMNAEIIARLQESFSGPFNDLSSIGLTALIKRLEATVEASDIIFMRQRDAVKELEARLSGSKDDEELSLVIRDEDDK
ncbi:Arc family DNA-binding protein [Mesorhizobium sp. WSM3876]|uniref:Arc family DNA-binding protein n=1 Tax=Mesorhizobium sp. WSM3876 TaxID=422277 RepID=UPI000BB04FE1|nr:Arc family DNA-binding protein [Mesorhizobium sp. WSM3876]PBB86629.1 hypothetical protein CK216_10120 [Mesorhizobium sp. WSM3876]